MFGGRGGFSYNPAAINRPCNNPELTSVSFPVRTFCAFAILLWLGGTATQAQAEDPDFMAFSAGIHDYNDDGRVPSVRLEYRSDIQWWIFRPFSGFTYTSDQAMYGYAGVFVDLFFGRRFVLQPSFAAGAYSRGAEGKNLGHWIEFRSQLEFAYRFDDRSRLGLSVNHISNASLDADNPGAESFVITYAVPFDQISGRNLWSD